MRLPRSVRPTSAALVVVVASVLPVHLTGALAPRLQSDLGFGDATLGLLLSVYFAVSALLSTWGGSLTDRIGPTVALRLAAGASGLALLLLGGVVDGIVLFALVLGIGAIGTSIAQPGANVLIARGVGTSRQGLALGIKQSAIAVSTALSGLVAALLAGSSWHLGYLLAISAALGALLLIPHGADVSASRHAASGMAARALLRRPGVAPAALTGLAGAAAVSSIGTFTVRAGVEAGFSERGAGLILTAGSVILIIARIGWGTLSDRGRVDPLPMVSRLLLAGLLGYAALATGTKVGLLIGAALAFGAGWSWPGLVFLGVVRAFPDQPGAVSGVVQTGMFVGAVMGPLLFGLAAEYVSFAMAWGLSAAWSTVAAVAARRMADRL